MEKILQKLESLETIEYDAIIAELLDYYEENKRHKYHEITLYIVDKFQNTEEDEAISILLTNLEETMKHVETKCNCKSGQTNSSCYFIDPPDFNCVHRGEDECYIYKNLLKKLVKLHDHISLEFTRLSDIRSYNKRTQKTLYELDKQQVELSKKIRNKEKKIDGMEKNYITILGIFASIVLAFTGGIAFSTSVLENINAISPYRLSAVVIGLAFTLINVIYILVWFICKLNKDDQNVKYPRFMLAINIILILGMIITLALWILGNPVIILYSSIE